MLKAVETHFQAQETVVHLNKGPSCIEKETISIGYPLDGIPEFPGLKTLIRFESHRQFYRAWIIEDSTETRYHVDSFMQTAQAIGDRIRGYWGVENKVHYVRDVTQGEDASRIRTAPLIQIWAIAHSLALNLYRDKGFDNMAQTQRYSGFGFKNLISLFRMK